MRCLDALQPSPHHSCPHFPFLFSPVVYFTLSPSFFTELLVTSLPLLSISLSWCLPYDHCWWAWGMDWLEWVGDCTRVYFAFLSAHLSLSYSLAWPLLLLFLPGFSPFHFKLISVISAIYLFLVFPLWSLLSSTPASLTWLLHPSHSWF